MQEGETSRALILRLFGGLDVELGGEPLPKLHSPKGLRVLAYLALDAGKSVDKTLLAQAIWPESENAGSNLDRTLRDLRRALGDPPRKPVRLCLVEHDRLQLQLQRADTIDSRLFQQMRLRDDAESLQKAVDLYQGPLLEGWGSKEGEGWIVERREQYRAQMVEALKRLGALAMAEGRYEVVLGYLRRQWRAGERDEAGWRDLMRTLLEKRDFENAALVYERFTEYVSSPSAEMQTLWEQIPSHAQHSFRERLLPDLPKFFTRLIGREEELRAIQKQLETRPSRLIVLTGGGGVGKTRLAVALGHRRSGDFAQGVRFIDLTSATDSASVLIPLCAAFKVTGRQELLRALQPKEALLILDNCEQAQSACSVLAQEILTACPRLHILATSRHAFNIGEVAWEVPCLALPPTSTPLTPEALLPFSAIQLFYERAQALKQTFALTPTNTAAVVEICRRLDGIPLAIELAAVQIKMQTPQEIAARLTDRFALLSQGQRNAQQRHQTLRATIEWSYGLLDEAERRLLRRLSVFAGGWREAAALAVCADDGLDSARIWDLLGKLVDKSLAVHSGETESRFRMLESILEYAAEKLAGGGEEERLYRKRHRDYFFDLVTRLNAEQSVQQQEQMLNTLDAEFYNLDQALIFCTRDPAEVQQGLRLGAALQEFWWIRGYLSRGRERLRDLLEQPQAQEHTQARAAALDGAGVLARMQGDLVEARALHEESLAIFRELGDDRHVAYVLGNLGIVVWMLHKPARAISLLEESLTLHRSLGNEEGVAYCLGNLGNMAFETEDYVAARARMEECLMMLRAQQNDIGIAYCLGNLGNIAFHQQDYASAYALHQESLTIKGKLQDKVGIALSLESMTDLAFQEGDRERGARLMSAEERLRKEIGSPKTPEAQEVCDRQRADALQTLGAERLSTVRAEGYAMTLEAAIVYALRT